MSVYQFQSRDDDEIFVKIKCNDDILKQQAHRTKYNMVHKIEFNEEFKEMPPSAPFDTGAEHEFAELKNIDRIRLMNHVIKEHIVVNNLIKHEIVLDFYPLHEENHIEIFKKDLLGAPSPFLSYNIDHIRDYFGERMMFYFLWMKFFTDSLLIPAIGGCVLYAMSWLIPHSHLYEWCEVIYAFCLAFWGSWFAIAWRRI